MLVGGVGEWSRGEGLHMKDDLEIIERTQRIMARVEELAAISETADGLTTRTFGSEAMRQANGVVGEWMWRAGLEVGVDGIGNVRGFQKRDGRPLLVMGSHLDTVREAGQFDGPLGVLTALDCAEMAAKGEYGALPFRIGVVGFADEEGVRFGTSYLGSDVLAGNELTAERLALTDANGVSVAQAVRGMGGDIHALTGDALEAEMEGGLVGYVEVHLEQGPVLEAEGLPVGVVSAIAGQSRFAFRFEGQAGHAGTTPMGLRKDALAGAAEFISAVESLAKADEGLVATVGQLEVRPGAGNVIPGSAAGSLDVRSPRDEQRQAACGRLRAVAEEIAGRRELRLEWREVQTHAATPCDLGLRGRLAAAVEAAGVRARELPSGAGHDAVALAHRLPVAMLFVRCKDGLSHHPQESVAAEDVQVALNVMDKFLHSFTESRVVAAVSM